MRCRESRASKSDARLACWMHHDFAGTGGLARRPGDPHWTCINGKGAREERQRRRLSIPCGPSTPPLTLLYRDWRHRLGLWLDEALAASGNRRGRRSGYGQVDTGSRFHTGCGWLLCHFDVFGVPCHFQERFQHVRQSSGSRTSGRSRDYVVNHVFCFIHPYRWGHLGVRRCESGAFQSDVHLAGRLRLDIIRPGDVTSLFVEFSNFWDYSRRRVLEGAG
mmetsp:Transcript_66458/g.183599  ORF Transcript_66458/g.183599 Transcript_66458/m.183599 type:complete len:220 (+) Transcript_66458:726-1385(+)